MKSYEVTIVIGESPIGNNEKGYPLVNFLSIFLPLSAIKILKANDFKTLSKIKTTYLFIFFPVSLKPDQLESINYKHLIVCEYNDSRDIEHKQMLEFKNLSSTLLKTSIDQTVTFPFKHTGSLPIALKPFPYSLLQKVTWKHYDALFLGVTTSFHSYQQRLEWIKEIKSASNILFFGGLLDHPHYPLKRFKELTSNEIQSLTFKKPLSQLIFMWKLARSKIGLCPTGHTRWTYRHYETILSNAVCVSTKVDHHKLLIPLPLNGIVQVNDHEPILPHIHQILDQWSNWEETIKSNNNYLNKYLINGFYSKKKPIIFERFIKQLH